MALAISVDVARCSGAKVSSVGHDDDVITTVHIRPQWVGHRPSCRTMYSRRPSLSISTSILYPFIPTLPLSFSVSVHDRCSVSRRRFNWSGHKSVGSWWFNLLRFGHELGLCGLRLFACSILQARCIQHLVILLFFPSFPFPVRHSGMSSVTKMTRASGYLPMSHRIIGSGSMPLSLHFSFTSCQPQSPIPFYSSTTLLFPKLYSSAVVWHRRRVQLYGIDGEWIASDDGIIPTMLHLPIPFAIFIVFFPFPVSIFFLCLLQ